VSAMRTVNIYRGRRWMGWYNSPGSFTIAKRYGKLANSRIWDGFFPGPNTDAATLFEFSGKIGPKFIGVKSGTHRPDSGHLSALLIEAARSLSEAPLIKDDHHRKTTPYHVTIVNLPSVPPAANLSNAEKGGVESGSDLLHVPVEKFPPTLRGSFAAALPVLISSGACVACGLIPDWYCFTMILVGMLADGLSCFILGSGKLLWYKPDASPACPPGDGILHGCEDVMLLLGEEKQVQFVIMGGFVEVFTLPHLICADSVQTLCSPWTVHGLCSDCTRTEFWWMFCLTSRPCPS
jgi:hypothetical protein